MDDWAHWKDNLAGKPVQFNESNPQAGFYRQPRKEFYGARKTFIPVAYWPGENEINCRIGDQDVTSERGRDIWTHVCRHPVSEDEYRKVAENGEPWSDEHELVPMDGSNRAPDDNSFEALQAAIEELARDAKMRIDGGSPIQDQAEADRIANQADRLAELWKKADEARKAEKRPHDEAATAVQKKWTPVLLLAETYKNLKYKLLTPWLQKLKETARVAAEEAAARGASTDASDAPRPRAGTRGRAMSLKSTKRAEITDYALCLAFFAESQDIKLTVQDLANKAVRAGVTVPGAKLIEEEQAV